MRRTIFAVCFALCCLPGSLLPAWAASQPAILRLQDDLRILHVARTLNLTKAQIDQIQPVLKGVQDRLKQQDATLAEAWKKNKDQISAVNKAWAASQPPDKDAVSAADAAANTDLQTLQATNKFIADQATAVLKILTDDQVAMVETVDQAQTLQQNLVRYHGSPSLADYMALHILVLRTMPPRDYAILRVAVAIELGQLLLSGQDNRFTSLVNTLVQFEDTVRQISDADYNTYAAQLPQRLVKVLDLGPDALPPQFAITYDDFLFFLRSPLTAGLLKQYKPGPPAGGEGK